MHTTYHEMGDIFSADEIRQKRDMGGKKLMQVY